MSIVVKLVIESYTKELYSFGQSDGAVLENFQWRREQAAGEEVVVGGRRL